MKGYVGSIVLGILCVWRPGWAQGQPPPVPPAKDATPEAVKPAAFPPAPVEGPASTPPGPAGTDAATSTAPTSTDLPPPVPEPTAAAPPTAEGGPVKKATGLALTSADGQSEVALRPMVHAQVRAFLPPEEGTLTFLVRRARPTVRAKLWKYFEVTLDPELAGSRLRLLEAHGTLAPWEFLQLKVGKGKLPLGLEYLQSISAVTFAELGLPSQLLPSRDTGAQLQGTVLDGFLSYAVGVYNGAAAGQPGDEDENRSKDVVGRVFLMPLKQAGVPALENLGLGLASSVGDQFGTVGSYATFGGTSFFRFVAANPTTGTRGAVSYGQRVIACPQGYFYYGPLGLLAEYIQSRQRFALGAENWNTTVRAWLVSGSLVIGGSARYQGVQVDHPVDPRRYQWGALELAARYDMLEVSDNMFLNGLADARTSAQTATEWVFGIHWYTAPYVALKIELGRTRFDGYRDLHLVPDETVLLGQLQVAAP
jgi:phosphate-selective porin OprO/OprP